MNARATGNLIEKSKRRVKKVRYEVGSGNVFADVGLVNPELELAKARFAQAIIARIRSLGLTQARAAQRMGIDQPRVSKIKCGRLGEFSLGTLFDLATRVGIDFDIVMSEQQKRAAYGRVKVRGDLAAA